MVITRTISHKTSLIITIEKLQYFKKILQLNLARKMEFTAQTISNTAEHIITEGSATIKTQGKVFYNPVQEFNRDLSITVINVYIQQLNQNRNELSKSKTYIQNNVSEESTAFKTNNDDDNTTEITILEALAASGLRSIRYAKEINGVSKIIANDISRKAVESMEANIKSNDISHLIIPSHNDAIMLMHQHKEKNKRFDVIDLDPYGCPSVFLDSAVQAVKDGGLLLVTATDMAILAGNATETCYVKYGAVSLKIKSCHEMALRILLQCIESHANRYGRYIEPVLSLSADFYIRVFVKVYSGANKCKQTTSKLSMVYHCTGCGTFSLQRLGEIRTNENNNQIKYCLPTGPPVGPKCEHCSHPHHIGGPIWSAPIHSREFVQEVLQNAPQNLGTYKRMQGVLNVILEELIDQPLYYALEKLAGTIHVETPPMMAVRSAIMNAGYEVSSTHANKTAIKTNAPAKVLWDIMRCWEAQHPSKRKEVDNSPAKYILSTKPEKEHSFKIRADANPESRRMGYVRFQTNPLPFWGPGTRATAMIGEDKMSKSKQNQGKRKREHSEENSEDN